MKKKLKTQNSKLKKNNGFTLVELLIYLALFSIFLTITTSFFTDALQVNSESSSLSSVSQDGRYIISQMTNTIRRASAITTPGANGNTGNNLTITVDGISNTYSVDSNYNLMLASGSATYQLTDYNSSVSAFTVTRLGNATGIETTIHILLTLQSRMKNATGAETETFQTTVAKRR